MVDESHHPWRERRNQDARFIASIFHSFELIGNGIDVGVRSEGETEGNVVSRGVDGDVREDVIKQILNVATFHARNLFHRSFKCLTKASNNGTTKCVSRLMSIISNQ